MEFQYIVTEQDEGLSISGILRHRTELSTRTRTKLKRQGQIFLNGNRAVGSALPARGDVIIARLPEEKSNFAAENIPIHAVYEDEELIVINKQAGLITHPTSGIPCHTLANGLVNYMEKTDQSFKIRFVNRLDMDTSGLLIVAKTARVQDEISRQMQAGTIEKQYLAVICGTVGQDDFTIDLPIGRPDPNSPVRAVMPTGGAPSITHVTVLERFQSHTLVALRLGTGRTHQIRVHMSHIGHPLVGDTLYGCAALDLIARQALHACMLSFDHPSTKERLALSAPVPGDIEALLNKLRKEN